MSESKSITITVDGQGKISWILVGHWWPFEVTGICTVTAHRVMGYYELGPTQTAGADTPADARQQETETDKEDDGHA